LIRHDDTPDNNDNDNDNDDIQKRKAKIDAADNTANELTSLRAHLLTYFLILASKKRTPQMRKRKEKKKRKEKNRRGEERKNNAPKIQEKAGLRERKCTVSHVPVEPREMAESTERGDEKRRKIILEARLTHQGGLPSQHPRRGSP
jgi:hypothetical protein